MKQSTVDDYLAAVGRLEPPQRNKEIEDLRLGVHFQKPLPENQRMTVWYWKHRNLLRVAGLVVAVILFTEILMWMGV